MSADASVASGARPRRVAERRRALGSLTALLAAHTLSQTGNVVTLFAVPFAVLAMGGGAVQVGIASFAATVPVVIGGPLGGVLVERLGYRRASIVADIVNGGALLLIPVLATTVGLPFWGLLALVFAGGLLDTPGQTARRVLVPAISDRAGVRLERSVGFLDAATRLSGLLGAPLAGLLVALVGAFPAMYATAVGFGLSAIVTVAFVGDRGAGTRGSTPEPHRDRAVDPDGVEPAPAAAPAVAGYWADLAAGARFVVRDPLLRLILGLILVTNLLDAARSNTLLPLYAAQELGGAASLGWIVAAFGGGALTGSVAFGFIAHRVPRRVTFAVCFLIAGGPSLVVFALAAPPVWLVVASAASGLAAGALNPILGAVEFERIPEAFRARVFGLMTAVAWAGIPVGGLLGGLVADAWGVRAAFAGVAVIYTAVCAMPLVGGRWRLMEREAIARDRGLA